MGSRTQAPAFRVVISGYYGFRNSGDEAVLKSILTALEAEAAAAGIAIRPVVLSADPAWTSAMYGVESAHRMQPGELLKAIRGCDGLISGGGSLLQDATGAGSIPYYTGIVKLAQWLGKPTFVYAQGIGPVNRGWMGPLIRSAMTRSVYVSVRDEGSAALLRRLGVKGRIDVVPDPVMGLPLPAADAAEAGAGSGAGSATAGVTPGAHAAAGAGGRGGVPVLGVALRRWRSDGADLGRAAEALAALAKRRAVRLRFLPFHTPDDAEASSAVMERLGALGVGAGTMELAQPGDDPQRMLLEVSRCDAMFGMRLHALIYAANREVPMLGLSYDPKIDSFLQRLGLEPVGSTEALDARAFADAAEKLLAEGGAAAWRSRHGAAIAALKEEAHRPAAFIADTLRSMTKR